MASKKTSHTVGDPITFGHHVSYCTFVITSKEEIRFSRSSGEIIKGKLYGIEPDVRIYGKNLDKQFNGKNILESDMKFKFFAVFNKGAGMAFGETAAIAKKGLLTKYVENTK